MNLRFVAELLIEVNFWYRKTVERHGGEKKRDIEEFFLEKCSSFEFFL